MLSTTSISHRKIKTLHRIQFYTIFRITISRHVTRKSKKNSIFHILRLLLFYFTITITTKRSFHFIIIIFQSCFPQLQIQHRKIKTSSPILHNFPNHDLATRYEKIQKEFDISYITRFIILFHYHNHNQTIISFHNYYFSIVLSTTSNST